MKRYFLLALLFFQSLSYADALQVYPIHITLSPDKPIATLKIINKSLEKKFIEIDGVKWSQYKNVDRYRSTNDLLVMPPIFSLNPGEKQIVRVAYATRKFNKKNDSAYRLIVNELPVHPKKWHVDNGLNIRLRVLLPVIYSPSPHENTQYLWQVEKTKKNNARLKIVNSGQKVILLTSWQLFHKKIPLTKKHHSLLYVLPNSKRYLSINSSLAKNLTIKSTINGSSKENSVQIID